jgi:hypothetical protein
MKTLDLHNISYTVDLSKEGGGREEQEEQEEEEDLDDH